MLSIPALIETSDIDDAEEFVEGVGFGRGWGEELPLDSRFFGKDLMAVIGFNLVVLACGGVCCLVMGNLDLVVCMVEGRVMVV